MTDVYKSRQRLKERLDRERLDREERRRQLFEDTPEEAGVGWELFVEGEEHRLLADPPEESDGSFLRGFSNAT